MYEQITTVRLPAEIRDKLYSLSKIRSKTKSDIIKEALEVYLEREENDLDSYTLGESYFGRYGSGEKDRATTYRERIRKKLADKMTPAGASDGTMSARKIK